MGAQRLDGVVAARKLRLGHRGVDLVVADLVHENRRPALAAAQAGDQVVQALLGVRRDGPVAEGQMGSSLMTGKLGASVPQGKVDALVIGTGPAGLMAAETLARAGRR
jgi:NADPH-dependent 2,4-dienoyl-CoA reductase/sulfur reductase-like enzyme